MLSTQRAEKAQWWFGCFQLANTCTWCLDACLQHGSTWYNCNANAIRHSGPPWEWVIDHVFHLKLCSWIYRVSSKHASKSKCFPRKAFDGIQLPTTYCCVRGRALSTSSGVFWLRKQSNVLLQYDATATTGLMDRVFALSESQGVYDVSSSANFQPGAAYHFLAGADATVGLAKMLLSFWFRTATKIYTLSISKYCSCYLVLLSLLLVTLQLCKVGILGGNLLAVLFGGAVWRCCFMLFL